ncbi:response regulator [Gellertiella hungarica]|uniref:PAS domain S-box-containing protein n=1 Tax=Gellertiella hungarica TaxID=1572859 RepID=A0A7W6J3Y3_9HYPH|nr:response regulator [Gellertiella hungarica]MBB4064331.1 PAS domain S-box-containing protein [Gellertiella hungarica]
MNDALTEAIQAQSPLLDIVCEALPAAMLVYDGNDQILFASKQILNFFSLPTEVLLPGTRLRDFLGAVYDNRSRATATAGDMRGASGRDDWVAERLASHWRERFELTESYGYGRWVRFIKRRFPSGTGICLMTDVTEHHKREEQWRADMARVQLTEEILDNLPFPVFVKDPAMTYIAVNRAFCQLRGVEADGILGRTVFDFAPRSVAEIFDAADRQVLETGEPLPVPERLVRPDGHEVAVITRKLRIGKPGRFLLLTTMEDVTELTEGYEQEGWLKTQLKMPLFPNIEGGEVLETVAVQAGPASPAESMLPDRFLGRRVLLVSSDVTVEAQAGRVFARLGIDYCCVSSALEQEAFLRAAAEAGVDIDVIVIDTQMEARTIELAEHHGINVLVMDGSQMSGELSYQLVRHFNSPWGRPRSERNPIEEWDIETIIVEPQIAVSLVDVLVVEDNPVNQIVFSQILEGLGHSARIVSTGEEALRAAADLMPRCILVDQTLPDMTGIELTAALRKLTDALAHVPVIGVLVAAREPDADACLAAGMNGTLMKPISPESLENLLRTYLAHDSRSVIAG